MHIYMHTCIRLGVCTHIYIHTSIGVHTHIHAHAYGAGGHRKAISYVLYILEDEKVQEAPEGQVTHPHI
jgi:hypothetical protein